MRLGCGVSDLSRSLPREAAEVLNGFFFNFTEQPWVCWVAFRLCFPRLLSETGRISQGKWLEKLSGRRQCAERNLEEGCMAVPSGRGLETTSLDSMC